MAVTVKHIRNRHLVEFDRGRFDEWCVYLSRQGAPRYAPTDTEYFSILRDLSRFYTGGKIYSDFVKIYELTDKQVNANVLKLITEICDTYGSHSAEMDIWFTVIYAGMIAEENKTHAILKKRIKRLGMHQVLMEQMEPVVAANFSRGKKWQDLDLLMKARGF